MRGARRWRPLVLVGYILRVRLSLTGVFGIVAISSAAAFALGRSTSPAGSAIGSEPPSTSPPAAMPTSLPMAESDEPLPPGHPSMKGAGPGTTGEQMPPGHPQVNAADMPSGAVAAAPAPASLEWKIPARWQSAPNTSPMRLATYRIPRAAGDTEDGDLSITQAGGTVDANAARWVAQFDEAGQKTAKRTARKVGAFDITIVEAKGNYTGMAAGAAATSDRAMLGAIVPTPGMPHFFKLTGPAKTVLAARAEFESLVSSFVQPKL